MAETTEGKSMPEAEKKKEQSLPFYQLFSFADKYDYLLMTCGSIGAILHGSSMPVFFLLFGEMVNGFGKNQMDLHKMTHEVSKYALYFVYLGLIVCASSYAEIGCWMYTGERQVSALRKKYLEAVLKQDVGFFDTDARTGDIVFSVSTDTLLVQDAISEKDKKAEGRGRVARIQRRLLIVEVERKIMQLESCKEQGQEKDAQCMLGLALYYLDRLYCAVEGHARATGEWISLRQDIIDLAKPDLQTAHKLRITSRMERVYDCLLPLPKTQ